MAVNALGQTLQLLLNQAPNNDLSLGLKAGDILQGRILDILPDNRAIIQIKGYNMLAQLPPPAQGGLQFGKGVMLDLAVLQAQPKPSSAPAPAAPASAPALTVKLLGISSQQTSPNLISQAGIDQSSSPLPQPSLEGILTQARLPINSANLQAAQSLIRYGLPVNAQTLNSVIQSAQTLIAAEGGAPAAPAEEASPIFPGPVIQTLNEAKTLLGVIASQPSRVAERPQIQALIRQIDTLLAPESPHVESNPAGDAAPMKSWPEVSQKLNSALNQVSDGRSQSLQNFASLLSSVEASIPGLSASHSHAPAAPQQILESIIAGSLPQPPAFSISIKREIAAFVSRELGPALSEGRAGQNEILAVLSQLDAPQSPRAEAILSSVSSQMPAETPLPQNAPMLLRQAVAEIKKSFVSKPLPGPLRSQINLAAEFESRGIEAPRILLSGLLREIVVEAVAFLKARDIPLTRPAIEAVASQLSEGSDLGQQVNLILDAETSLPQEFLNTQPQLTQEFKNLREFLSQNGIRPEGKNVAVQIRDFVLKSGLDLEHDLASLALGEPRAPMAANPADTLKAGLLKLREAVQQAGQHANLQASPELGQKLEQLGSHISSAINVMHTLQMASQPTPAFDVNTFQIPVFFGGQLQSGQLSIYWKKGRPHELSGQDPVNVVFLLNTRGLGDVKVQLQVWKNECRCKVSVSNDEARKFIEAESAGLQQSFSENTPFKLSSLDFSGAMSPLQRALDFVEDVAARGAFGLNLTA